MLDAQRPLAHTQVMRSATAVATPAVAFAATARAPLTTAQQQQQKAQQSITKPTARALSASMHAPKGSHGDGAYLHASFQIGSTHGRVSFGADERVFHRSDVPPAARQAVEEVTALLRTGLLQRDGRPWNSSTTSGVAIRGSKCCSWETPADRFDDRYYHKLESETRVQAAKRRVDAIRCGHDPDWDPRNQNPRWNVSTLPEEQVVTALSATKIDQQQQLQPSNSQFLPEDYKSLLQQQRNLSLHYRAERATAAEQQAERATLAESWASFARAAHVNGPPTQPQLERAAPVEAQIQEAAAGVARQYPPDVLTTFLWQQENPEAAAAAGLKPLDPAPGTQQSDRSGPVASRYALPPTVHHAHRHDRSVAVQQSVPYSSKLPPAWYRAEARTKQLAKSTQEAPFPKFQHPGVFVWVEGASDSTDVSSSGGVYRWSCCLHPLRDARGCQAVDTDPNKRRLVVARSDDPSSAASWGLGAAKMHRSGSVGATATAADASQGLDSSHVRSTSSHAAAALSHALQAAPVSSGGGGAALAARAVASGMGLSGPGVAVVQRREHSGRYELHRASGDSMWSCCGAASSSEPGCVARTIAQEHRWQLASP